ncbi:MAG: hypothetical protein E7013_01605 [Alphaproteobacteria bacterium]|nr:hypothetical protein [Alphaproteobacteria bacterium]
MKNFKKSVRWNILGRSMVEMLGVLAIIGILSIGAVAGIDYAIEKHNTNVLVDDILLANVNFSLRRTGVSPNQEYGITFTPKSGLDFANFKTFYSLDKVGNRSYVVRVDNISKTTCEHLLNSDGGIYNISSSSSALTPFTTCGESNTMYFYMKAKNGDIPGTTLPDPDDPSTDPDDPTTDPDDPTTDPDDPTTDPDNTCTSCPANSSCVSGACQCNSGYHDSNGSCVQDCSTCPSGQYCDAISKECLTCPTGYTGVNCSQCATGYYSDGSACIQLDCTNGTVNGNVCACNEGYYGTTSCTTCPGRCLTCTADGVCTSCETGYSGSSCTSCATGYYSDGSSCLALNCTNGTVSGNVCACSDGYYGTTSCTPCPGNCETCNSNGVCTSCIDGYTGTICSDCDEGYYADGSTCIELTCENGTVSGNVCACNDGYYGTTSCSACPGNCKTCDSNGTCTSCIDGYTGTTCTTCASGYYADGSACVKLTCENGTVSGNVCACNDGYYGTTSCSPCPGNCATCDSNGACKTCIDGYTGTTCTDCASGYYADGGTCIELTCENGTVDGDTCACNDGYYGTTSCIPCPSECATCDSDGVCTSCQTGYYLSDSGCLTCASGCYSCQDGTSCLSCNQNYYLSSDTCVSCGQGSNPIDNTNTTCTCDAGEWNAEDKTCASTACASDADCNGRGYCENQACVFCEEHIPYYVNGQCRQCATDADCTDSICLDGYCSCQEGTENCFCAANQYYTPEPECQRCVICPDNASCNGTNEVSCQLGYIENNVDCFLFCCNPNTYFSGLNCLTCPDEAICNGTSVVSCTGGKNLTGRPYDENLSCDLCSDDQYLTPGGSCKSCPSNAVCKNDNITCNTDYYLNYTEQSTCCHKTNEFSYNGSCLSCPSNATCNGVDFTCKEGLTKTNTECVSNCSSDGSDTCSECNSSTPYYNGSKCVACVKDTNCGSGKVCEDGACKVADAECSANQYYYDGCDCWCEECASCPDNATCDGVDFTCKEGYIDNRDDGWYGCGGTPCCSPDEYWNDYMDGYCEDCPENAICNGTSEVSCKDGMVENDHYDGIICCKETEYFSDYDCRSCPEHGICDGTYEVSCEDGYHRYGEPYYDENEFGCAECTENSHCSAGYKCENRQCVRCKTDGSETCPTCSSETPYYNGGQCVRCIISANCDRNGECSNNECINQTPCNANEFLFEYWGECRGCPSNAICNGTEKLSCKDGYVNNYDGSYFYDTPCCSTNKYWAENYGEGWCSNCPENGVCNGTSTVSCQGDSVRNEDYDGDIYCCLPNSYFTEWNGCVTCPEYGVCDGTDEAGCEDGYNQMGEVWYGDFSCVKCEWEQFYAQDSCHSCPEGADCDGLTATCNGDYITHNSGTAQMACCHKTNQFLNGTSCASCPSNATCDGTNFTCKEGFTKSGTTCIVTCATDGSATCDTCNVSTPYFNGSVCKTCIIAANCGDGKECEDGACKVADAECSANQYYYDGCDCWCEECASCPDNATCDGVDFTCKEGYIDNRDDGWYGCGGTPCCSPDEYWNDYMDGYCEDCPENAICNGTSEVSCKDGFVENDHYDGIICCKETEYFSDYDCRSCPEYGICDGTYEVSCEDGYHRYGEPYYDDFGCYECTENSHCSDGYKCENRQCVACKTDGSSTCPTCSSETPYFNGSECVRCIISANCDRSGECSNNECINQTPCNPNQFYYEWEDWCGSCPSNHICDGTATVVCKDGYVDNSKPGDDIYGSVCCHETNQYWDESDYDGGSCSTCPDNSVCNGTIVTACKNGYVYNEPEYSYASAECCSLRQYYTNDSGCCDCPENAVCDGKTFECRDGYETEEGYACEEAQWSCNSSCRCVKIE